MTADNALTSALAALRKALQELSAPSMIIGGIAVIAHGVGRQTVIDATIWAEGLALDRVRRLVAEFAEALEEPSRIEGFETLVDRALGER